MICPKCGFENTSGTLFCSKCGSRLTDGPEEPRQPYRASEEDNEFDDTIIMKPVAPSAKNKNSGTSPTARPAEAAGGASRRSDKRVHAQKTDENESVGRNGMKTAVVLLSCCLVVLMAVLIIFSVKLFSSDSSEKLPDEEKIVRQDSEKNNKDDEKSPEPAQEPEDTEEKPESSEPETFSTIPVDMIYSSTERTEGEYTYLAQYASDAKLSTAWSPRSEGGAGENITLCFSTQRTVHGLKISNGYAKSDADYQSFARLKGFTVKFPDGTAFSGALSDNTTALQDIKFSGSVDCQSLTIYVDSVYNSDEEIKPLCISEIEVY